MGIFLDQVSHLMQSAVGSRPESRKTKHGHLKGLERATALRGGHRKDGSGDFSSSGTLQGLLVKF